MSNRGWRTRRFQVLRYGMVGGAGFVVDAALVSMLVAWTPAHPLIARILSFSVAVITTWILNRTFTFVPVPGRSLWGEFVRYISVNSLGVAINYTVYSFVLLSVERVDVKMLLVGVTSGSAVALVFNYLANKLLVFGRS